MQTVLVTGGTGFLGSWCVVRALESGYRVRVTVRSLAKADVVRRAVVSRVDPGDRLDVVAADLGSDDGWAQAVAGVDGVLHVASPLPAAEPTDRDEVVRPAVARYARVRPLRPARQTDVRIATLGMGVWLAAEHGPWATPVWATPLLLLLLAWLAYRVVRVLVAYATS